MVRKTMGSLAVLMTMGVATMARADEGWLKRAAVVRSEQSPAGDAILNVYKGAKVDVQTRDGAWVQIQTDGKTGWVATDSVSSREVRPDTTLGSSTSGAELSSGAAVRGIQPLASSYSRNRHLSAEGLAKMHDIRDSVTAKMLKDFMHDGGISTGRKTTDKKPAKDE